MSNQLTQNIRLSVKELQTIISQFKNYFLNNDMLWLFGSRVDLSKKGGDIDLYIETNISDIGHAIQQKNDFLWALQREIGEQRIDVVLNILNLSDKKIIYQIAKTEGVKLV